MSAPSVCVINAPGINCNKETAFAFEQAGALTEQVHISQLTGGDSSLSEFQILALSGGFSDGDTIASGRTFGIELKTQLSDGLNDFVAAGGLIIGICNGFQLLTETGLLPEGRVEAGKPKTVSLAHNNHGMFIDSWQHMKVETSRSLFLQPGTVGEHIELPIAHGEGRVVAADTEETLGILAADGQVVLRYVAPDGSEAQGFPDNPNGSLYGITALCDPTGQILGMMPHPERFVLTEQHPNWRRGMGRVLFGGLIIQNIVNVAKEM